MPTQVVKRIRIAQILALVLAPLLGACVAAAAEKESGSPPRKAASAPAAARQSPPAARRGARDGLDSSKFRNFPPEAKEYLRALSEAFQKKDKDFLISQGEIQYENEYRLRVEEKAYLAMLYRVGPYSEEDQWKLSTLPLLEYADVKTIEYADWEEKGPMLEISGYLYFDKGQPLPCRITLAWRLLEPKILGARPE